MTGSIQLAVFIASSTGADVNSADLGQGLVIHTVRLMDGGRVLCTLHCVSAAQAQAIAKAINSPERTFSLEKQS